MLSVNVQYLYNTLVMILLVMHFQSHHTCHMVDPQELDFDRPVHIFHLRSWHWVDVVDEFLVDCL